MNNCRIFIGLTEIAGYYSNLKQGFARLGVKCDFFTRDQNPFRYKNTNQNFFQKAFNCISQKKLKFRRINLLTKSIFFLLTSIISFFLLFYSILKYDIFIFGFKECFFPRFRFFDLILLRLFRKKIIFVFNGSDARPPYIDGALLSESRMQNISYLVKATKKQKQDIRIIEKYAHISVNHPPTSYFHEKKIISYLHIGIPTVIREVQFKPTPSKEVETKILHCPSNIQAKGTQKIRSAIQTLIKRGHKIDYIEITGKPNRVVRKAIRKCDFVIDQMYSNSPMPGFVSEAASFQKAAVICGYFHEYIHKILPEEMIPPSHYCHPDDIENAIERLIIDKKYRTQLGKKAFDFIKTKWNPEIVAKRYMELIEGNFPPNWLYDPNDLRYIYGGSISKENAKEMIRHMIEAGKKSSLQLSDKPYLENAMCQFAYLNRNSEHVSRCESTELTEVFPRG